MSALPAQMAAVEIVSPGGPEQLVLTSRPMPQLGPQDVLIRVHAAGVNRPDVFQRKGQYAPPPGASDIPGLEVAGEIVAVGSEVARTRIGEQVTALVAGGGYAAFAAADDSLCLPIPQGLSILEAAALPETVFTVWSNLFDRGGCKAGDAVLIHGGTSGIGTIAIQLARAFGARVYATAGSPEKARMCETLGAHRGINYRTEDFVEVIKHDTNGNGVDVVLDIVAGSYAARNMAAAAQFGRIVCIATLGGARTEIDWQTILHKRLTLTGSTLRSRPVRQKADIGAAVLNNVWPLLAAGKVKPVIHGTFPLAEAAAAHRLMESSVHTGKIMLQI